MPGTGDESPLRALAKTSEVKRNCGMAADSGEETPRRHVRTLVEEVLVSALRYLPSLLAILLFWLMLWRFPTDPGWYLWLLPLILPLVVYLAERRYYRCPACGKAYALELQGDRRAMRASRPANWRFRCRHCAHELDRPSGIRP